MAAADSAGSRAYSSPSNIRSRSRSSGSASTPPVISSTPRSTSCATRSSANTMRAALCGRPLSRAARRARVATFRSISSVTASSAIADRLGGQGLLGRHRLAQHRAHDQVALQPGDLGRVDRGRVDAVVEPPGRGEHDGRLAERRQHAPDVLEERAARADHQHAAAGQLLAVGVEQVGHAVQRDRGLPGAGAALDHDHAGQRQPDHRVLLGLDRRDDVAHRRAAGRRQRGQQRRIGRGGSVSVSARLAAKTSSWMSATRSSGRDSGELEMASADQSHRARQRGAVERPGRGRPPVEQRASRPSSAAVSPIRPT